ncbi:TIGR03089 family protein [Cellulomonas fengjieae]|uniref:TIGR03089 family protein n=1 Tax=Cellulomonas fengjieae TaxID=2819978 RepID=A0ABS3SDQ2_9CELL|nr:TIGR03089 family protein [Cellulomonas fengjieae]MBO3083865.1 TIGR03089 family protein [Cellulomonas fengjieae]QVI64849.1 TIGR03089 family protein [Cellulomonas fengjieae]
MPATTTSDLLHLLTREPGRPRITWYGDGGERVELSGAVLENWVSKTTNLLVEEFDAGPGTRVRLDLPGHWRTLVWALATWRTGAEVVMTDRDDEPVGLVVSDRPDRWPSADPLVVVALPALARSFPGALPPRAIDAAAAVMTYGDVVGWAPATEAGASALPGVAHGALLAHAQSAFPADAAGRVLLDAGADRSSDVLVRTLATLARNGSVVLTSAAVADELRHDEPRRARLVDSERITDDELG